MSAPLVALRSAPSDDVRPLVVALHGFGAHEGDLAPLQPFLGEVDQVSLRAPLRQGDGWMWFPITTPGVPDPAVVDAAADRVQEWIDAEVPATRPVVLLGFSQGGTTALQVLRRRPGRYRAVVLLSGFVAPGDVPGDTDPALRQVPVFWGRDTADPVIAPVAIARTADWLPRHVEPTVRTYEGIGHGIGRAELADVAAFLAAVQ